MSPAVPRPVAESRALRAYLQAVVVAGAVVLAQSAAAVHMPPPTARLLLTAVTMLAGCFRLHFKSVSANIAIDDTFFISTTLLFGPAAGTLTMAVSCLLFSVQRRKRPSQIAFNTASLALSMYVASRVFFALSGVEPRAGGIPSIDSPVQPLGADSVGFLSLQTGLTPDSC